MGETILPCGTYRPETTFGVTNLWLNPEVTYVRAKVNNEEWIVSEETIPKLANQKYNVTVLDTLKGKDLIGKKVLNQVTGMEVPILPAPVRRVRQRHRSSHVSARSRARSIMQRCGISRTTPSSSALLQILSAG